MKRDLSRRDFLSIGAWPAEKYAGFVDLEYEIHADDPMPGVALSFAYMHGVLEGMGYAMRNARLHRPRCTQKGNDALSAARGTRKRSG
jgi:hypothetical protein